MNLSAVKRFTQWKWLILAIDAEKIDQRMSYKRNRYQLLVRDIGYLFMPRLLSESAPMLPGLDPEITL